MEDIQILQTTNEKDLMDFATKVNPQGVDLFELQKDRTTSDIPVKTEVQQSFNIDRLRSQPTGLFQRAVKAERQELYNGLLKFRKEFNQKFGTQFTEKDFDFILFFPNARFTYLNKLIKNAIKIGGISTCDAQFIETIWMSPEYKEQMTRFFDKLIRTEFTGFTVEPIQSRSGLPLTCRENKLVIPLRNPGNVVLQNNELPDKADARETYKRCMKMAEDEDEDWMDEGSTQQYIEPGFIGWLKKLQNLLTQKTVDLPALEMLSKKMADIFRISSNVYLASLLDPTLRIDARIPSQIPIPTAAFHVRTNVTLTSNANGNVAWAFNPFFLTETADNTALGVNNDPTLTGTALNNNFDGVLIGQNLPISDLYGNYRLVSARLQVTYVGSTLNASGYATQAISYDCESRVTAVGVANSAYMDYGNFTRIENGYFRKTMPCIPGRTISNIYLPVDNKYTEFTETSIVPRASEPVYTFVGYASGLPPSTPCLRMDVWLNFEATVTTANTDYIPTTIYKGTPDDYSTAMGVVSQMKTTLTDQVDNKSYKYKNIIKPEYRQDAEIMDSITEKPIIKLPTATNVLGKVKEFGKQVFKDVLESLVSSSIPGYSQVKSFLQPYAIKF